MKKLLKRFLVATATAWAMKFATTFFRELRDEMEKRA